RWLAAFVRPERWRLAGVLLLSLAASGLALVQPWLTRPLIDQGLLGGRFDLVLRLAGVLAGLTVLAAVAGAANQWLYVSTPVRERASDLMSFLVDTLAAMKLVQSVAAEERETRRLGVLHGRYLHDLLRLQATSYAAAAVPGVLTSLTAPIVWLTGGALVIEG